MRLWLILLLALLGVGLALSTVFYWTARQRDLVRRPVEKTVGCGSRRALLIYQPSNRGKNHTAARALAAALAGAGYTVTVNYPSPVLAYEPQDYDLLLFGGSAYIGTVGRPLKEYLSSLHFRDKPVLLFVVGDLEQAPELAGLRLCVPEGNHIRSIKIRPGEERKLCRFALN
ncbi:hypothetical protein [Intestinimonas sp.]|uniref:hypothetical protein n=1 Tax=Intestinimonas sp. TaxID=1965293 RepID=UPI002608E671|nr:hypothetical protein [Intestinimonas sp.]